MKIPVLGSTEQTGYQVVKQLLERDFQVKAMARRIDKFHDIQNDNLEVIILPLREYSANPVIW